MELERLEVVFDGDLSPFEQKLEAMQGKLDTILGRVKQTASSGVDSIEKNFNNTKSFDKFTQQLEKMNANFEKQLNRTNQTANKQGEQIGQAMSNGVSKGTVKMTKDVQTALDKVNTQMQQAKVAQQRIANLQADKNGANLSGDTKGASKIGEQISKAQIQMNKSQQQAQAIVRGLKSEYDAIPNSLSTISAKMEGNERQIESMRAKVKALKDEMKMQQTETGNFSSGKWQSTGTKDTPQSNKTGESIAKQSAKMEKLIADNDALQRAYAQLEDRSGILKSALSGVNTELGAQPVKARMAANGMKNLSGSTKQSEGLFSRFKNTMNQSIGRFGNLFSRQSKQVTSGTSRMSQGMGGFGRSMKMLWSQLFLFTVLYQGIMTLASGLFKALQTNAQFSASLNQIKVNLLTAFYPIYQAALPAINALMAGLAKVTGYIAGFISTLFGMNIGDAFNGAQGLMNNVQALDDTGSAASDASDGYDEIAQSIRDSNKQLKAQHDQTEAARKKVKEYKRLLAGFDELNILDFSDDSNDEDMADKFTPQEIPARPKTPKASGNNAPWADFANAQVPETPKWLTDFANKFKDIMSKLFDPIKKAWDAQGKRVMDAFKYSLSEIWKLIKSIGKSFLEVWTNGTGQKFVENLLILLGDVLYIIGDIAKAFRIAWDENGRGTQLIQQIFDALNQWLEVLHDIAESFREVWNNGTGIELARQLIDFYTNLFHLIETIGKAFQNAWNDNGRGTAIIQSIFDALTEVLKLINSVMTAFDNAFASGIGESILANIMEIITNIFNTVGNLAKSFHEAWDENSRGQTIFEGITKIIDTILGTINRMTGATAEWAAKLDFRPLLDSMNGLLLSIQPLTQNIGDGLEWFYKNVLLPLAGFTIEDLLPAFFNALAGAIDLVNGVIDGLKPAFDFLWNTVLQPIAQWTGGVIVDVLNQIGDALSKIGDWISQNSELFSTFIEIIGAFGAAWIAFKAVMAVASILSTIGQVVSILGELISSVGIVQTAVSLLAPIVGGLSAPILIAIGALGSLVAAFVLAYQNSEPFRTFINNLLEDIKNFAEQVYTNYIKPAMEEVTNAFETAFKTIKGFWDQYGQQFFEACSNIIHTIASIVGPNLDSFVKTFKAVFDNVMSIVKIAWDFIKDVFSGAFQIIGGLIKVFTGIFTGDFHTALEGVKDMFSGAWKIITSGFEAFVKGFGAIAKLIGNALVGPIEGAVNGVIGGINWVLDSVNVDMRISKWDAPRFYAKGTNYHPGGPAVVNDASGSRYQEMFKLPNGQMGMFPKQRNMLVDLPKGTQVLPGNMVPQYSGGVFDTFKDFFSNGFDKAKGIADDVWDIISNPSKLVDMAMDKFVNLSGMLEPMSSMAFGFLSNAKNAVVNMVTDMINKFTGFSEGGLVDQAGFYQLAEGNQPEMVVPLSKPQLAFERMKQALDFMGVDGIPELTMPDVFKDASQGYSGSSASGKGNTSTTTLRGNGLDGLTNNLIVTVGETVASAIMNAFSQLDTANDKDAPFEVILEVDSTRLGQVTVKGINQYHEQLGTVALNL